jgi:hypothetical protein
MAIDISSVETVKATDWAGRAFEARSPVDRRLITRRRATRQNGVDGSPACPVDGTGRQTSADQFRRVPGEDQRRKRHRGRRPGHLIDRRGQTLVLVPASLICLLGAHEPG